MLKNNLPTRSLTTLGSSCSKQDLRTDSLLSWWEAVRNLSTLLCHVTSYFIHRGARDPIKAIRMLLPFFSQIFCFRGRDSPLCLYHWKQGSPQFAADSVWTLWRCTTGMQAFLVSPPPCFFRTRKQGAWGWLERLGSMRVATDECTCLRSGKDEGWTQPTLISPNIYIYMNFVEVAVACKISYVPAIVLNSMQVISIQFDCMHSSLGPCRTSTVHLCFVMPAGLTSGSSRTGCAGAWVFTADLSVTCHVSF